jgi:protein O-GlcNAc transferase
MDTRFRFASHAPAQAYYSGYFASAGLTEMDYFIGDEILTPPETDDHFSEQVWRLHMIRACYEGKADAPPPAWQPDPDGSVWIGSFNNLEKLTSATLSQNLYIYIK